MGERVIQGNQMILSSLSQSAGNKKGGKIKLFPKVLGNSEGRGREHHC